MRDTARPFHDVCPLFAVGAVGVVLYTPMGVVGPSGICCAIGRISRCLPPAALLNLETLRARGPPGPQ